MFTCLQNTINTLIKMKCDEERQFVLDYLENTLKAEIKITERSC